MLGRPKVTLRSCAVGIKIALRSRSRETFGAVIATAIAALFLALASGLPSVVSGAAERAEQRAPHDIFSEQGQHQQVEVVRDLRLIDGKQVVIAAVSPPVGSGAPVQPPPGIPRLPEPGEFFASPALEKELEGGLDRNLLPGKNAGNISNEGLRTPHELFAWVGATPEELHKNGVAASESFGNAPFRASGFGLIPGMGEGQYYISRDPDLDRTTNILLLVCAIVAAIPCLISAATASKLLAQNRAQSLKHLIAAGVSHRTARMISATEVAVVVLAGWIIGLLVAPGAASLFRWLVPESVTWFPGELKVYNLPVLLAAALSILFCFFAALRGKDITSRRRTGLSAVWWLLGIAMIVSAAVFRDQLVELLNGLPLYLGITGLAVSALFFRSAVEAVSRWSGQIAKRMGDAGLLGGARLTQEATSATRGPAAIGLAVLAASLTALITSQLVSYLGGEGIGFKTDDTAAVIETHHAADIAPAVGGFTVVKVKNDLYAQCDTIREVFAAECTPGQETESQIERLSIIGQLTAGTRVLHALGEGKAAPSDPNAVEFVVVPEASEQLTQQTLAVDPFATIQSSQTIKNARMYAASQVVELFRIAAWGTVIVAAVFVIAAAVISASQRQRLQAVLSVVGTSVRVQRTAWMVFSLIPLAIAVLLSAFMAVVVDVAFLHLLDMPAVSGNITQAVVFGGAIMLVLGMAYAVIISRAVGSSVDTTALRSE